MGLLGAIPAEVNAGERRGMDAVRQYGVTQGWIAEALRFDGPAQWFDARRNRGSCIGGPMRVMEAAAFPVWPGSCCAGESAIQGEDWAAPGAGTSAKVGLSRLRTDCFSIYAPGKVKSTKFPGFALASTGNFILLSQSVDGRTGSWRSSYRMAQGEDLGGINQEIPGQSG